MKPKIVVSACLAGECCRYDGGCTPHEAIIRLVQAGRAVPLCPEQLGGLPTPRPPCEVRGGKVWNCDGRDCTEAFYSGAAQAVKLAKEAGCSVAILKARSPSCGTRVIYDGTFSKRLVFGEGIWAAALRQAGFSVYTEEEDEALKRLLL